MLPHSLRKSSLVIAISLISMSMTSLADDPFTDALKSGKASANIRLRSEKVDDDAFKMQGKTTTIRSRIAYETAPFHAFTLLTEFEDIHVVGGADEYAMPAPPTPPVAGPAVIADPEMTELNRMQLRYRGVPKLDMVIGRQRLIYDNHRFIGNVGFRQDEQTYDAFSAVYTGITDFTFNYAYIDKVKGFTPAFDTETSDNLINISYNGFTWGKFIAYKYNLQNQNHQISGPAAFIHINQGLRYIQNDTVGLRFDGMYVLPTTVPLRAIYRAEYAKQEADIWNTPGVRKSFEAKYTMAELGMWYSFGGGNFALTPLLGYEVLGSDEGAYGLQTPYATKHAFQGWVDQFLVTPKEGLKDKYISLAFDWTPYNLKTLLMYHKYSSDEANTATKDTVDFGTETNLQVLKTIGANWIVGAKYAAYKTNDDEKATSKKKDADKIWAWVELNF